MRLRREGLRGATIAGVLVALVGCANAAPGAGSEQTEPTSVVAREPINWDSPIALGVLVSPTDGVTDAISFQPLFPSAFGNPLNLVVNDPDSFDRADRGFAAQYKTADGGIFWLIEEPSDMTQKDLEGIPAQCDPAQGCEEDWSVTKLGDGSTGLLIDGLTSVGVVWLHDGVYIDVVGPPDSFAPGRRSRRPTR